MSSRGTQWFWPIAILIVLALHVWYPDTGTGILHDTYSPTADGQKAFYRLVSEQAGWTDRNTTPLVRAIQVGYLEPTLCILGPERWPTTSEWEAILDWVAEGGELLLACRGFEEATIPELDIRYVPRDQVGPPDDSLPPQADLLDSPGIAWWTDGRLVAPHSKVLVEYDGTTQAVSGIYGEGRYVVTASSLIFSNQLLTYGDNPVLAMRLLEQVSYLDGVTFDESLNSTGTPKTIGLLFDPDLRPITLQLILLTFLYGWWNSLRFGPWHLPAIRGRHNIVDHTDAVGLAYWRSKNGVAVLRAYVQIIQQQFFERSTGHPNLHLWESAARRLGQTVSSLQESWQQAHGVAQQKHVDRRVAADLIRKLSQLRAAVRL
ncbi:hypothetical protein GC163_00170 [bacterium]|nr:hypothetical protein [bacterium]